MAQILQGKLPTLRSSRVAMRTVKGYAHSATGIAMKDGTDYVFDWWPTLNQQNPLISTRAQWGVGGSTVEFRKFKGHP
jgi:hypothetical protein